MTTATQRLSAGTVVAGGMLGMNVAIYVFTVVAARATVPAELGALIALLNVLLLGNVVALGLQAATARRIAVDPSRTDETVATVMRVATTASVLVGGLVAAGTVVLTPALRLDSPWPVVLAGATLVPLTLMGAQAGVAQGSERWRTLTAIYLANGFGRLGGGVVALLVEPTATSAMVGIAVGSWAPVVAGAGLVRGRRHTAVPTGAVRSLARETLGGSHALLATFALSGLDALVARNRFDADDAGLYAAGLILAKAALFAPQFVSVVLFPDLARDESRRSRTRAALAVVGLGVVAVAASAALPRVALVLVGGDQYADVAGRLWLFALAGSTLALVHLLVQDALARRAHGVVIVVWAGTMALVAAAYLLDVHVTGLVTAVAAVAACVATVAWFAPGHPAGRRGTST